MSTYCIQLHTLAHFDGFPFYVVLMLKLECLSSLTLFTYIAVCALYIYTYIALIVHLSLNNNQSRDNLNKDKGFCEPSHINYISSLKKYILTL